jgi:GMP synthase-like glutamine amidotransferase
VLGSRLYRSEQSEIGWLPVRTYDPGLVSPGPWFQWHFDSFSAPPNANVIAETDVGPQAFVSGRSLGLQFHPEVTPEIMDDWVRVYPHELEAEGVDPEGLLTETRRRAEESKQLTWTLFDRFRDRVAMRDKK